MEINEQIRFLDNLDNAIAFHQTNQNDPHGVGTAVITSLVEVRTAFAAVVHLENYAKALNPSAQ